MACSALTAATGTADACSNVTFDGFGATAPSARTVRYSAKATLARLPYTSSPGWKPVAAGPTVSTTPAKSAPSPGALGRGSPAIARTT